MSLNVCLRVLHLWSQTNLQAEHSKAPQWSLYTEPAAITYHHQAISMIQINLHTQELEQQQQLATFPIFVLHFVLTWFCQLALKQKQSCLPDFRTNTQLPPVVQKYFFFRRPLSYSTNCKPTFAIWSNFPKSSFSITTSSLGEQSLARRVNPTMSA